MKRNFYGALTTHNKPYYNTQLTPQQKQDNTQYDNARSIVQQAIKQGLIPDEFCEVDREHCGSALNYAIYDIGFFEGFQEILVQKRETTCTKYGNSPKKEYLIITKNITTNDVTIKNIDDFKAKVVKLAKTINETGDILAVYHGLKNIKIRTRANMIHTMYKSVAIVEGRYLSIFDGITEYILGKEMIQAAKGGHQGGYYCYSTIESAKNCQVPDESKLIDAPRAILKLSATGNHVEYGNGKIAFTKITPISEEGSKL